MDTPIPDVRDIAPEAVRANISSAFAAVLTKGLRKRVEERYSTLDEMATELYGCLVQVMKLSDGVCNGASNHHIGFKL